MRIAGFLTFGLIIGCTTVLAQQPPPVADNANPQDRGIKDRSIEMERVKRDENKSVATGKPGEAIEEKTFSEIKEDFEQIQVTQSAIVAAYQKSGKIDYQLISTGAEQISKRGIRLRDNLFPVATKEDKKKKDKDKNKQEPLAETRRVPDDVGSLIADIDNTLALFVANAMFSNMRVVNAEDHVKAKADLEHIIALSNRLHEKSAVQVGTTN
jgi:hypothetical protein